ncbi:Fc receptor-like protein 5 isoform X2 [Paramisgurnus dabryanus]|uniref:Fc receptor-like protein 5 isoform X2 n=1 Tax=Paramisgurnus dabryanus TaxID=90735 RepID=UPI003CCFD403
MEMYKILLLTVAVIAPVTSQNATDEPIFTIPQPEIIPNPAHKVLYSTEKVSLQCSVSESIPDLQYEWFKDSSPLNSPTDKSTITVNAGGTYECRAKKRSSVSDKSNPYSFTLQAIPTPKLTLEPKWTEIYPSEKVTLSCEIQGSSDTWTYRWFKNNEDLGETNPTLTITAKSSSDSGEYACKGKINGRSVITQQSNVFQLNVRDPLPKPRLTQTPDFQVIYTGEKLTFNCKSEVQSSGWEYLFFRNSNQIKTDTSANSFSVTSAQVQDSGKYWCQTKRITLTSGQSDERTVTVKDPPSVKVVSDWTDAFPGETVTLQCVIQDTSEKWTYTWFKDRNIVSSGPDTQINGNTLSISVKPGQSGTYTYVCQAELEGRSVKTKESSSHSFKVHESMPTITLKQDPEYPAIYTEEQVRFTCSITEQTSPSWTYQWKKDNTEVSSGGQTYTISSATMLHKGSYTCHISRNGVPFSSEPKKLTIIEPPQPQLSKEPQWDLFYPTEKVTLTCSINENPNDWEYEWYKNEIKLSKDNDISISEKTLSINSAKSSHSGSYTCKAKHLQRSPVTTKKSEALQLHISGSMPTISLKQDPEYPAIYTGEQVRLTCSITEQTSTQWTYQWKKDNTEVSSGGQTYTISSATMLHKGSYTCHISRNGVPFSSEPKQLTIIEPPQPQLSKEPQWDLFYPTEKVTLTCSINENPNDWEYEWYKNEIKLSKDNDISISEKTLSINSAKSSHSGSYTCKAKHLQRSPVTTKEAEALQLHISDSTPEPDIRQDPSFEFFYTDEQVRLTCNMPGAAWEYHWYKDSETTELSTANKNYIINSASLHDTGEYYCKAKRRDFSINSGKMKVQVKEPPQPQLSKEPQWDLFYPIEKVILTCSINENPNDWEYEWYNNKIKLSKDNDISISGKTLSINFAKSSHSGNYKCKAKHLRRSPVTTKESEALHLNISVSTPKPVIQPEPSFEFFYTDERVQLTCDMPGAAWEYYWYKDSKTTKLSTVDKNYIINSASAHDAGDFYCEAKRRDFLIQSEGKKVQVKALSAASLNLVTELSDIIAGNILTLNCKVLDDKTWNYTWFENNQELNESSSTLKVKSTEETIKNEFKCRGKRTERPLYSYWSDPFMANNILFKRKILLAISGCFVCCIVILIIGCIVLKITRKPEKKEPVRDNLFISLADSKNQTTSPLMEYMESKPLEKESEEKEELQLDSISVTHVDGVIKGEDSPSAETNGLTSFKAS